MFDVRAEQRVIGDLCATAAICGPLEAEPYPLRWGPLLVALDETIDQEYVTAMELIYEGYLLHYRQSRVSVVGGGLERSLLAGDVFYARGLHLIAARGDVDAVDLLARLMASCSCLRVSEAPFSEDDALWAYTVGGLVALRRGVASADVSDLFDQVDTALTQGRPVDVRGLARAHAERLMLPDPSPLEAEIAGAISPTAFQPPTAGVVG